MSEEMNRREAELNEAALEGVSGGGYLDIAQAICRECSRKKNQTCMHSAEELAEYIGNGHSDIGVPGRCPFFRISQ